MITPRDRETHHCKRTPDGSRNIALAVELDVGCIFGHRDVGIMKERRW